MNVFVCSLRSVMKFLWLGVFACLISQSLWAATVVVGTCKPLVHFSTIQAALNASPANTTIDICPGTYAEQLTITRSVALIGVANGTSDAIVIVPPAGGLVANTTSLATGNPIAAHIWASGVSTFNITNVIVDSIGNNIFACAPDLIGILYQNSSGTVNHVVTRNQWVGTSETDTNFNGCQSGLGIFVQSGSSGTSTVTVSNSSVHDYQKNGITGNETGTTLTVTNNDVVGQGSTTGAAENGIQIGFGAAGTVTGNLVIDDVWAPDTISDPGDAAAGILLFDNVAFQAAVKTNTVGNTQFGIVLVSDTPGQGDGVTVASNKVFGTRIFDAIDVCTNGNTIQTNTVVNSAEAAIHLDASCGSTGNNNLVTGNTLIDACTGVLSDGGTSGNSVSSNTAAAVGSTTGSSCVATPSVAGGRAKALRSGGNHRNFKPARP
jgi:hypothetical protein